MPVLIKVPGTSRVRVLLGFLAPYVGDPFVQANSPLDGKFLALKEDIDRLDEAPPVITLSDMVLTRIEVMAPTTEQFLERMVKNNDEGRPKYGSNPYPVQVRVDIHNTFTLRHITTSLFRVSNLNYPLPLRTNQMQQGSSLPTQAMFHGR
jgi:hypothetical protein